MMLLLMYETPTTALVWFSRFAYQLLKMGSPRTEQFSDPFHPPSFCEGEMKNVWVLKQPLQVDVSIPKGKKRTRC
jgi:hypothetical protein